jgi:hypothetical protein
MLYRITLIRQIAKITMKITMIMGFIPTGGVLGGD